MNTFPDSVMKRLATLATDGEAISNDQATDVLGLTPQQYHRLTLQEDFPHRTQLRRQHWLHPQALLEFCQRWNRLACGLTVTQIARLIHCTVPTARRLTRDDTFPKPLGEIGGRDRWDRDEIVSWHRARVGGATLPAVTDAVPKEPKPKTAAKGIRNARKQTEKRRDA